MIGALRRVFGAPGLVVFAAAVQLAVAAELGAGVRTAVGAAMGRYAAVADGHLPYALVSLLIDNPGIPAGARHLLAGSAMLALALWTLLAAGILHRLHAPASASEVAATTVRGLPGVVVVTLWQLLPRLILIGLAGFLSSRILRADSWGWLGFLPILAVLGYVTCALDLARCDVVLHGARHAIWIARALAVLGVVFALARMAVAVGAGPPRRPSPAVEPEPAEEPEPEPVAEATGYDRPSLRDGDSADQDPIA